MVTASDGHHWRASSGHRTALAAMRSLPRRFALAFATLGAPCVLENASFQDASGEPCSLSGSDCAFGLTSDCAFGDWPKLARFFLAFRFFTEAAPWRAARA